MKRPISLIFTALATLHLLPPTPLLCNAVVSTQQSTADLDSKLIELKPSLLWQTPHTAITSSDLYSEMKSFFQQRLSSEEEFSDEASKAQFFLTQWPYFLRDMIDRALVYEDALEQGMDIEESEVKETINTLLNDECVEASTEHSKALFEKTKRDMIIDRMLYYRIQYKGRDKLTPGELKKHYDAYIKENPAHWNIDYLAVTLDAADMKSAQNQREELSRLLAEAPVLNKRVVETAAEKLGAKTNFVEGALSHKLSKAYQEIFAHFETNILSPLYTFPRGEGLAYKVFVMTHIKHSPSASFEDMRDELESKILSESMQAAQAEYISQLRKRYHLQLKTLNRQLEQGLITPFVKAY